MMHPELCASCGGKCCISPRMTTAECLKVLDAIGQEKARASQPIQIKGSWKFRTSTCPALTPTGCIMPYENRPEVCRIYPLVRLQEGLFLDIQACPHWQEFGEDIEQVEKEVEHVNE
jgi:Fe-S-cluster containining protein